MKRVRETNNWQLDCAEMKKRGEFLFRTKLWSDIVLQFDNKKFIRAHKLLLAMASPVFGSIFYDKAYLNPVKISDVPAEVFNVLLEYIYSDNIQIPTPDYACDLYYAGRQYKMPHITQLCVQYLSRHINHENVCHIYEVACLSGEEALRDACLNIIRQQTKEVLHSDSFTRAEQDTVVKLFALENLDIDSELDLYVAAVKYADAHDTRDDSMLDNNLPLDSDGPSPSKRARLRFSEDFSVSTNNENSNEESQNNVTKESDESTRDDARKSKYSKIVQEIRFLTLTPAEFAECKLLQSLLTDEQILALSLNIASKDTPVKMPEGFSYSMVPRSRATQRERQRISAKFHSKIHNVATLKKFESIPFYLRNTAWTFLMINDLKNCAMDERLGIAVTCYLDNVSPDWLNTVKVKVKFYSKDTEREHMKVTLNRQMNAYKQSRFHGIWTTRLSWREIMHPLQPFVEDNTLTYKVSVFTEDMKTQHDSNVSQMATEGQNLNTTKNIPTVAQIPRRSQTPNLINHPQTNSVTPSQSPNTLVPKAASLCPTIQGLKESGGLNSELKMSTSNINMPTGVTNPRHYPGAPKLSRTTDDLLKSSKVSQTRRLSTPIIPGNPVLKPETSFSRVTIANVPIIIGQAVGSGPKTIISGDRPLPSVSGSVSSASQPLNTSVPEAASSCQMMQGLRESGGFTPRTIMTTSNINMPTRITNPGLYPGAPKLSRTTDNSIKLLRLYQARKLSTPTNGNPFLKPTTSIVTTNIETASTIMGSALKSGPQTTVSGRRSLSSCTNIISLAISQGRTLNTPTLQQLGTKQCILISNVNTSATNSTKTETAGPLQTISSAQPIATYTNVISSTATSQGRVLHTLKFPTNPQSVMNLSTLNPNVKISYKAATLNSGITPIMTCGVKPAASTSRFLLSAINTQCSTKSTTSITNVQISTGSVPLSKSTNQSTRSGIKSTISKANSSTVTISSQCETLSIQDTLKIGQVTLKIGKPVIEADSKNTRSGSPNIMQSLQGVKSVSLTAHSITPNTTHVSQTRIKENSGNRLTTSLKPAFSASKTNVKTTIAANRSTNLDATSHASSSMAIQIQPTCLKPNISESNAKELTTSVVSIKPSKHIVQKPSPPESDSNISASKTLRDVTRCLNSEILPSYADTTPTSRVMLKSPNRPVGVDPEPTILTPKANIPVSTQVTKSGLVKSSLESAKSVQWTNDTSDKPAKTATCTSKMITPLPDHWKAPITSITIPSCYQETSNTVVSSARTSLPIPDVPFVTPSSELSVITINSVASKLSQNILASVKPTSTRIEPSVSTCKSAESIQNIQGKNSCTPVSESLKAQDVASFSMTPNNAEELAYNENVTSDRIQDTLSEPNNNFEHKSFSTDREIPEATSTPNSSLLAVENVSVLPKDLTFSSNTSQDSTDSVTLSFTGIVPFPPERIPDQVIKKEIIDLEQFSHNSDSHNSAVENLSALSFRPRYISPTAISTSCSLDIVDSDEDSAYSPPSKKVKKDLIEKNVTAKNSDNTPLLSKKKNQEKSENIISDDEKSEYEPLSKKIKKELIEITIEKDNLNTKNKMSDCSHCPSYSPGSPGYKQKNPLYTTAAKSPSQVHTIASLQTLCLAVVKKQTNRTDLVKSFDKIETNNNSKCSPFNLLSLSLEAIMKEVESKDGKESSIHLNKLCEDAVTNSKYLSPSSLKLSAAVFIKEMESYKFSNQNENGLNLHLTSFCEDERDNLKNLSPPTLLTLSAAVVRKQMESYNIPNKNEDAVIHLKSFSEDEIDILKNISPPTLLTLSAAVIWKKIVSHYISNQNEIRLNLHPMSFCDEIDNLNNSSPPTLLTFSSAVVKKEMESYNIPNKNQNAVINLPRLCEDETDNLRNLSPPTQLTLSAVVIRKEVESYNNPNKNENSVIHLKSFIEDEMDNLRNFAPSTLQTLSAAAVRKDMESYNTRGINKNENGLDIHLKSCRENEMEISKNLSPPTLLTLSAAVIRKEMESYNTPNNNENTVLHLKTFSEDEIDSLKNLLPPTLLTLSAAVFRKEIECHNVSDKSDQGLRLNLKSFCENYMARLNNLSPPTLLSLSAAVVTKVLELNNKTESKKEDNLINQNN